MSRKEVVRLILSFVILTSVELGTSYKGKFLTKFQQCQPKQTTKNPRKSIGPIWNCSLDSFFLWSSAKIFMFTFIIFMYIQDESNCFDPKYWWIFSQCIFIFYSKGKRNLIDNSVYTLPSRVSKLIKLKYPWQHC